MTFLKIPIKYLKEYLPLTRKFTATINQASKHAK